MLLKERKKWAVKIAEYILKNEPVTLEQLEERAKGHDWFTWNEFDAILMLLKKDTRISATLTTTGIIYKKKKEYVSPLIAERLRIAEYLRNNYPETDINYEDSPFKCCFCSLWRTPEGEIYDAEKHGHHDHCDAILFPELFNQQNIRHGRQREQDPISNFEIFA